MTIKERMITICKKIEDNSPHFNGNWGNYEEWMKIEDSLYREVAQIDKEVGKGLHVGRMIILPHADGYAYYWVWEVKPRTVQLVSLPFGDGWCSPVVSDSGTLSVKRAEDYLRWDDKRADLFANTEFAKKMRDRATGEKYSCNEEIQSYKNGRRN
jgi:hypothetical protein